MDSAKLRIVAGLARKRACWQLLAWSLLLYVLCMPEMAEAQRLSASQTYTSYRDAIVHLRVEIHTADGKTTVREGSGILLGSEGFLLTNSLLLGDAGPPINYVVTATLATEYGVNRPVDVVFREDQINLALLKLQGPAPHSSPLRFRDAFSMPPGTTVFCLSFDNDAPVIRSGMVSGPGRAGTVLLNIGIGSGSVGAPIFAESGEFVGLLLNGENSNDEYMIPSNFALSLTSRVIHSEPAGVTAQDIDAPANGATLVYIQIARESERPVARDVQGTLERNGFAVPGVENVGQRAPTETEVRYFWPDDRASAEKIQNLLPRTDRPPILKQLSNVKVRRGVIEVWFAS